MECHWLGLIWLWLCAYHVHASFIRDVKIDSPQDSGTCFYNGTWFEEDEELPTRGLCLICRCFQGFTEPNAFTCSVIDCPWDEYHKKFPGCTPIYADRDCCPIGWECDYGSRSPEQQLSKDSICNCEWRYLKHYEAKGCKPVYEEKPLNGKSFVCQCPWRFDCSSNDHVIGDDRACTYKKQIYPVGSKINTTNPCETCSCVTDYFTQAAAISCVSVECPSVYSKSPLKEGCHYVYKDGECCPVGVECPSLEEETSYKVPICEYNGKMYYEGEQIYPDEDPCLICLCEQDWTGINSSSCRQHDCMLERDSRKLKQGCIPIYHEKTCCPIDYHCADDSFDFKKNIEPSFKADIDEGEMCLFEEKYYAIGHVLDIKHPTNCVTCSCNTPPDFTCIHSSCPPPPNNDYVNCKAVYKPHSCCPDYTCAGKSSTACPDPICNGTNCWLVKQENGCSLCRCKSRCIPCPDMCQPENPDNECSGCICQLNTTFVHDNEKIIADRNDEKKTDVEILASLTEECQKMKCSADEKCVLLEDMQCMEEPCFPVPKCEKVLFGCEHSTCPTDCEKIGAYDGGACPICYCKGRNKEFQYRIVCDGQFCEKNCTLTGRDAHGCPICKCPQYESGKRICPPSLCNGYNCTLTLDSSDCPKCQCQFTCKPSDCPSECDIDLQSPMNGRLNCGCHCRNSSTAVDFLSSHPMMDSCPKISCKGYNCITSEDANGCPRCACKEPCLIPKCLNGCHLESSPLPGRCPGCVCKLSRAARDNTLKECPPPTCQGYNCSVTVAEDDGCQKCICESPCEEAPKCPSHCQLEEESPEGRCRGCICSLSDAPGLQESGKGSFKNGGVVTNLSEKYDLEFEKREDAEADFIPLPGKDIIPDVGKIYFASANGQPDKISNDASHLYIMNADTSNAAPYLTEERNYFTNNDDSLEEKELSYDYMEEKGIEEHEKCVQKNCPSGQTCVIRRLQCIRTPCPVIPVCIDIEPVCPIPTCAIGCMVMKWDDEVCPSCFCGIIRGAQGKVCPRVPCLGRRCYNVIGDDGCPNCKCDSICIPPKCSSGCYPDPNPLEGRCPTCYCSSQNNLSLPTGTSSSTERLTSHVVEVTTSSISEQSTPGYEVSRGTSASPPSPVKINDASAFSTSKISSSTQKPHGVYHCPTPHCNGYNCSLIRGRDGCQKCVCDSPCAPCPPYCVKTETVSEGRCPICDCTIALSSGEKTCPPAKCSGFNCRKVKDSSGCLICVCDPECATPKCDPGCDVLLDVPTGQCPGCVCKVTVVQAVIQKKKICASVSCSGVNCKEVRGSDGCPKCFCDPLCPPPKCDPGCEVQTDVAAGQCPTCVCSNLPEEDDEDDDDDESYCPNLFCADYGCREIPGPAGCPICLCDPVCRTPVCDPGCDIVTNKYLGRCPVCICSSPLDDSSNTSKLASQDLMTTISGVIEPVVAETEPFDTMIELENSTKVSAITATDSPAITVTTTTEILMTTTETPTEVPTTTTKTCPPPICQGLQCRKIIDTDGCTSCKCRFKCPKPRCQGSCYAEINAPSHRCPGCICPSRRKPSTSRTPLGLI